MICVCVNTHQVLERLKYIPKPPHILNIWSRKYYSMPKQHMKFELEVSLDRATNSLWDEHGFSCPTSGTMAGHRMLWTT